VIIDENEIAASQKNTQRSHIMTKQHCRFVILIVDDDTSVLLLLERMLANQNFVIIAETDGNKALKHIAGGTIDLLIVDYKMPAMDGFTLLKQARTMAPRLKAIMLSGSGGVSEAVKAIKMGAVDYLEKKSSWKELQNRVNQLHEDWLMVDDNETKIAGGAEPFHFKQMVGESQEMTLLKRKIIKVARTDTTVLIQGESGTGKELVARAIHHHSKRNNKPFIPVDCASMSETVIESELFGHEKGAYTGAESETLGLIRSAHQGILFLDEIGEQSMSAQAKLLRTLQERTVRPVGSTASHKVDLQIIAATNRALDEEVEAGNFRQDLYYRLNAVTLKVPPLRERIYDIEQLAKHFLKNLTTGDTPAVSISESALDLMKQYDWPGNIREMENVFRSALVFTENTALEPEDFPPVFGNYISNPDKSSLPMGSLAEYEKAAIRQALIDTGNNRRLASEILDIAEATLYRKIKKYRL